MALRESAAAFRRQLDDVVRDRAHRPAIDVDVPEDDAKRVGGGADRAHRRARPRAGNRVVGDGADLAVAVAAPIRREQPGEAIAE